MAREVHDTVAQGLVSVLLQLRAAEGAHRRRTPDDATAALAEARAAAEARLRGDPAQRARARAVAAGGPLARGGPRAASSPGRTAPGSIDARLVTAGEPVVRCAPRSPTRCSGSPRRRSPTRSATPRPRSVRVGLVYAPDRRHPAGAGRRRGVRPGRRSSEAERSTASGCGGMAERARLLGGTLELESTPGWGTRVRARIPHAEPTSPRRRAGGRPACGCWSSTTTR